jgi:hypothetical protein
MSKRLIIVLSQCHKLLDLISKGMFENLKALRNILYKKHFRPFFSTLNELQFINLRKCH